MQDHTRIIWIGPVDQVHAIAAVAATRIAQQTIKSIFPARARVDADLLVERGGSQIGAA